MAAPTITGEGPDSGSASWRADRFTLTTSGGSDGNSSCHARVCRQRGHGQHGVAAVGQLAAHGVQHAAQQVGFGHAGALQAFIADGPHLAAIQGDGRAVVSARRNAVKSEPVALEIETHGLLASVGAHVHDREDSGVHQIERIK